MIVMALYLHRKLLKKLAEGKVKWYEVGSLATAFVKNDVMLGLRFYVDRKIILTPTTLLGRLVIENLSKNKVKMRPYVLFSYIKGLVLRKNYKDLEIDPEKSVEIPLIVDIPSYSGNIYVYVGAYEGEVFEDDRTYRGSMGEVAVGLIKAYSKDRIIGFVLSLVASFIGAFLAGLFLHYIAT